jgi:two-component system, LytTR family, response regulator LytT
MTRILIIEDEEPAAKRLLKMIREIEPAVEITGSIASVSAALEWFGKNPAPDLIISDIQLADGTSFDIFKQVNVLCPVIFVTAYDQFAIDAFKLNSVDYLLKPLKKDELLAAISKFKKTRASATPALDINKLLQAYTPQLQNYKSRFIVRYGEHIKTIHTDEIAYFYTEDKINFLTTHEGRRFSIDFNLDNLETLLDPKTFFRINRQFIVSISSIAEMFAYTKGRVLIKLKPAAKQETIVSTERSAEFKDWLDDGR